MSMTPGDTTVDDDIGHLIGAIVAVVILTIVTIICIVIVIVILIRKRKKMNKYSIPNKEHSDHTLSNPIYGSL